MYFLLSTWLVRPEVPSFPVSVHFVVFVVVVWCLWSFGGVWGRGVVFAVVWCLWSGLWSFTPQALEILNSHFEKNTHPSGQEMTEIAEKLNYDREVVRVWFCNKRQALKNTIKRLKQPEPGPAASMDPLTDSMEELPK